VYREAIPVTAAKLLNTDVLQDIRVATALPSEMIELILLRSSWTFTTYLWSRNNEDAVGNTYRLLSTVCHDWWSFLKQPSFQRSLGSILRSNGTSTILFILFLLSSGSNEIVTDPD